MSDFTDRRLSRRGALRAGAAALTAGTTALTGCSALESPGSEITYGTVSVPDSRPPTYREWLPAPDAVPEVTGGYYDVLAYEPPPADAPAWTKHTVAAAVVASNSDYVGVHIDDIDVGVGFSGGFDAGGAAVLAGDIDTRAVRETIAQTSYEPDGAIRGYEVYARPETDRVCGVSTDGLVFGNGPSARAIVASTVAAHSGDSRRYHEISANFEALSASAGSRRGTWLRPSRIRSEDQQSTDTAGRAAAFSHDDDTVYRVLTWLYPEGHEPTRDEVTTTLERRPRAPYADAVEISVDGRVATAELSWPLSVYYDDPPTSEVPFVTWRVTHDAAAETLYFRHESGDTIRTDRLAVRADGIDDVTEFDVGDTLDPGEALTVSTADVESGATVRLIYRIVDGESTRSATLTRYEL